MPTRTFHMTTLGCKINQYETQALREGWTGLGLTPVADPGQAQVILVNSCAVTARAVADLRGVVRALHRQAPDARILITGCAAQIVGEELLTLPGVVRVVGHKDKAALALGPEAEAPGDRPVWPPLAIRNFERARAVVKIQDGCSHRCTYCVVPLSRGPSVTRPFDQVVDEISRLFSAGFRELVLSGVNLGHIGRDLPGGPDFWDLLGLIESEIGPEWAGRARLRVSSLEPGQLGAKALDTLSAARLICPHLHLSLQSGSPEVLRRMGRGHYRPGQVLDFLADLRGIWPLFGLGADLLAGFPGETEAHCQETLDFVAALPLTYAHVFPYSARPGTPAATFPGQVPGPERTARAARLRQAAEAKKRDFARKLLDQETLTMVVEDSVSGLASGVCEFYVSCHLEQDGNEPPRRSLVQVRPVQVRARGALSVVPVQTGEGT